MKESMRLYPAALFVRRTNLGVGCELVVPSDPSGAGAGAGAADGAGGATAEIGPTGYCSPRHRVPFNAGDEGSK